MAIKDWHGGQLVVLWGSGVVSGSIEFLVFYMVINEGGPDWIALIALAALLATPVVLLVVTWKWFGGKR